MVIATVVVNGPATPRLSPGSRYWSIPVAPSMDERGIWRSPQLLRKGESSIHNESAGGYRWGAAAGCFRGQFATTEMKLWELAGRERGTVVHSFEIHGGALQMARNGHSIATIHTTDAFFVTCHVKVKLALAVRTIPVAAQLTFGKIFLSGGKNGPRKRTHCVDFVEMGAACCVPTPQAAAKSAAWFNFAVDDGKADPSAAWPQERSRGSLPLRSGQAG
jgi:hypothetical protein